MAETSQHKIVAPQEGYQTNVLACSADIVISGGAAGLGKTFSLLLEPTRHINVKGFGGVIFRRTSPQIRNEGGLWDTSKEIYFGAHGIPRETTLEWLFPVGTKIKFSHLEHENSVYNYQGAQIAFIGFDELTHFSKFMFRYMLSRNRSNCGIKPYVRATCNPDPDSWVAEFISPWIDQETGFPIPEMDGVILYMMMDGDNYIWGNTVDEVLSKGAHLIHGLPEGGDPKSLVKSVAFISGSIYDNKKLLSVDPGYIGNLLALPDDEKNQLLRGNWKVVENDKDIYSATSFRGLFDNVRNVDRTRKCIIADIALEGSNKFVVGYWEGFELMDIEIMDKSNGPQIIATIIRMAQRYGVNNSDIVFDADGVGGFVSGSDGGYIPGAISFHGGSAAVEVEDETTGEKQKENYFNLRAQCYYRSGKAVQRGERKINPAVANRMYDDKMTVRQRFMHERRAVKKDAKTPDGKLKIIKKDEMKVFLNGDSPDMMDMLMMREMLELIQQLSWVAM